MRWLLYRHSSTRTRRDTANLKALDKHNRRIYRAWRLKEEFEQFRNYKATWAAERFLKVTVQTRPFFPFRVRPDSLLAHFHNRSIGHGFNWKQADSTFDGRLAGDFRAAALQWAESERVHAI